MPSEALAAPADGVSDDDYKAFYAVLASSARGRAFLAEHARRARHAETETLLAAITRIEATLAEQRAQPAPPPPAPPVPPPAATTALAAVAAQAMAAAESDLPVMRVIKAGQMPPPARFAGDDFRTGGPVPEAAAETSDEDDAGPDESAAAVPVIAVAEPASEPVGVPAPLDDITDAVPAARAASPAAPVTDALAAILALSEEERLALFS